MMKSINITYFDEPGNKNIDDVIKLSVQAAIKLGIKKIAIFAASMLSIYKIKDAINDMDIEVIVTTYGHGRKFRINSEIEEYVIPEVSKKEIKTEIIDLGFTYIQGGLPFENILSSTGDNSAEMIVSALNLISKGLSLCISAAVMSYENGYIDEEEKIIAISGDTSVVVTPSSKRDLFNDKFRIHQIICKPI